MMVQKNALWSAQQYEFYSLERLLSNQVQVDFTSATPALGDWTKTLSWSGTYHCKFLAKLRIFILWYANNILSLSDLFVANFWEVLPSSRSLNSRKDNTNKKCLYKQVFKLGSTLKQVEICITLSGCRFAWAIKWCWLYSWLCPFCVLRREDGEGGGPWSPFFTMKLKCCHTTVPSISYFLASDLHSWWIQNTVHIFQGSPPLPVRSSPRLVLSYFHFSSPWSHHCPHSSRERDWLKGMNK